MAELLLTVRPGSSYGDDDLLCAFSEQRIALVNAQHRCSHKRAQRNGSGLILPRSMCARYNNRVRQFRFERRGPATLFRVETSTGTEVDVSKEFKVRETVRKKRRHPQSELFGEDGREIWFGGRYDFSLTAIQDVWTMIQNNSKFRQTEERERRWRFGRQEVKSYLPIRMKSITEERAQRLIEPQYATNSNGEFVWVRYDEQRKPVERGVSLDIDTPPDESGHPWELMTVKKRRRRIDWRAFITSLGATQEQAEDPQHPIGTNFVDDDEGFGERWQTVAQPDQEETINVKRDPVETTLDVNDDPLTRTVSASVPERIR